MWLIYLYPLFWLIILLGIREKNKHRVYSCIILLFLMSALASCYLFFYDGEYSNKPLNIIAIVYHLVLMWILVKPVKKYDRMHDSSLRPVPDNILTPFSIGIIVVMMAFIANNISRVSLYEIAVNAQELRGLLYEEDNEGFLMSYVNYIGETYSIIPLALMFYYMKYKPNRKLLIYMLFVCSLGEAVVSLGAAGREYILKYIFIFSILFYLMSQNLSRKWMVKLRYILLTLVITFGGIFLLITWARFTLTRDISGTETILSYFGQGNVNFSERFMAFPDGVYQEKGQHTFPLIFGNSKIGSYNLNEVISTDVKLNVFSTGIGSWLCDAGVYLTVLFSLFFAYIYKKIGEVKTYNVFTLIYFALVYEQIFSLLFFFHGTWNGTRVLCIAFLIVLDFMSRNGMRHVRMVRKLGVYKT